MTPWYYAVVERYHELQNPTSPEKIRLLGIRLGLTADSQVLDVAAGKAGPAVVLAREFGCRLTCVEQAEEFVTAARQRVADADLDELIDVVHADARRIALEPDRYDAALCLGASFVWDGLQGTLEALTPAVRPGGCVVVGEPYWREWPVPGGLERGAPGDYVTLPDTVAHFERAGLEPIALIDASLDDWDRYETLRWLAAEEWLHENADDPGRDEIRERAARDREAYLRWQRDLLGWAIIAARKRRPS